MATVFQYNVGLVAYTISNMAKPSNDIMKQLASPSLQIVPSSLEMLHDRYLVTDSADAPVSAYSVLMDCDPDWRLVSAEITGRGIFFRLASMLNRAVCRYHFQYRGDKTAGLNITAPGIDGKPVEYFYEQGYYQGAKFKTYTPRNVVLYEGYRSPDRWKRKLDFRALGSSEAIVTVTEIA